MLSQNSDFRTAFGTFDGAGKTIEPKQDIKNIERNRKRIQAAYAKPFGASDMREWKGTIENTDLGVIRNFHARATELKVSPSPTHSLPG